MRNPANRLRKTASPQATTNSPQARPQLQASSDFNSMTASTVARKTPQASVASVIQFSTGASTQQGIHQQQASRPLTAVQSQPSVTMSIAGVSRNHKKSTSLTSKPTMAVKRKSQLNKSSYNAQTVASSSYHQRTGGFLPPPSQLQQIKHSGRPVGPINNQVAVNSGYRSNFQFDEDDNGIEESKGAEIDRVHLKRPPPAQQGTIEVGAGGRHNIGKNRQRPISMRAGKPMEQPNANAAPLLTTDGTGSYPTSRSRIKSVVQQQLANRNLQRQRLLSQGANVNLRPADTRLMPDLDDPLVSPERQLQHEIEAYDDAPYKPGQSSLKHYQNKITTTMSIDASQAVPPRMNSLDQYHFATEGCAATGTYSDNQQLDYYRVSSDEQLLCSNQMKNHQPNRFQQEGVGSKERINSTQLLSTTGQEEDQLTTSTAAPNQYQKENQKIEYVTKSYQGSAWCCQSSETTIDQSQFETRLKPLPPQAVSPRQLTFKEKVVEMIGWGNCAKAAPRKAEKELTLISEEDEMRTSASPQKQQQSPPRQGIISAAAAYPTPGSNTGCPLPKLKLTPPPQNLSIMPRTRRQQLGLTPQTNMRLFKCDEQINRKSIVSNQSIVPCSEDSFASNDNGSFTRIGGAVCTGGTSTYPQSSNQNLAQYNAAKQAMVKNNGAGRHGLQSNAPPMLQQRPGGGVASHNLVLDKQSTHSYEYKSSVMSNCTHPEAGSIIENLHALNINIQKREKELEMRTKNQREDLERQRLALINADSKSVNSQIPCETDSGGDPTTLIQPDAKRHAPLSQSSLLPATQKAQPIQQQNSGATSELSQQTKANKRSISVNFESVIMLENKLNRITKCLVMVKFAEEQATQFQYATERQQHHAIQNYQIQHEELIGLCEEYWTILRQESYLFCHIPQRMFRDKPKLVAQIKKAFILKLLAVSLVGFLTSNEEFIFNDSYLREQMVSIGQSFLTFMRILLSKITPAMLANFFWARKLHDVVQQKLKFMEASSATPPSNTETVHMTATQAIEELSKINAETNGKIRDMFEEIDSIRQDEEVRDSGKFDHPLFQTIADIQLVADEISFKDASSLIGRSLVSEFSELDSSESALSGDEALNNARRNEATGGQPMNQLIQAPFLPPLSVNSNKTYTLVLDLDETLVHYYEEKNTVLLRPYSSQFLQQMAQFYEIVIFTAGTKDYADWALAHLHNQAAYHFIDHRLYRDHTIQCMDVFIKDLSNLGRDLDKTIIVDNITENFLLQPENGISIKSWFDDPDDTALLDLAPLLRQIVEQQVPDIRIALKESKEQLLSAIASGEVNPTQRLKQLSFSDRSDALSGQNQPQQVAQQNYNREGGDADDDEAHRRHQQNNF